MDEKKKQPLLPMILAGGLKTGADIGKFTLGQQTENILRSRASGTPLAPGSFTKSLQFGRKAALGSLAGLATFPLLTSGISDLRNKNPEDDTKGLGKILAAASMYSGVKGAAEHGARHKLFGAVSKEAPKGLAAAKPYLAGAAAKMALGVPASLIPALAIAHGMRKEDGESRRKSLARVAIAGGLAGGLKGGAERAIFMRSMGEKSIPKLLRESAVAGGGKVAGGVIGALILDQIVRLALHKPGEKVEKRADAPGIPLDLFGAEILPIFGGPPGLSQQDLSSGFGFLQNQMTGQIGTPLMSSLGLPASLAPIAGMAALAGGTLGGVGLLNKLGPLLASLGARLPGKTGPTGMGLLREAASVGGGKVAGGLIGGLLLANALKEFIENKGGR